LFFQKIKSLKPGDTDVILQIRKRLFITRDLKIDSQKKYLIMTYWRHLKYKNAHSLRFRTVAKHISI
jgi:hypothetical protein